MIPKFYEFYPYILEILSNQKTYKLSEIRDLLAKKMDITEEERQTLVPSKTQTVYNNRVNWACIYLAKAEVIKRPKRGQYTITSRGKNLIKEKGFNISKDDLERYESFRKFLKPKDNSSDAKKEYKEVGEKTPEDQINDAFEKIHQQLSDELLTEIMNMSPLFFEKLVLDLLKNMGYGGKDDSNIIHTQYVQDDGIDGMIKEDELGLDYIYVQAKRWTGVVGQPEIQKFSGALSGKGAKKGIFLTTSYFSKQAIEYANNHQISRIVLVDGKKLADLMITYGVGLSTDYTYKLQKIDKDYFDEDGF